MANKPILFNSEMVRAILDGRKTQTRRVIKPQPIGVIHEDEGGHIEYKGIQLDFESDLAHYCPYGVVGDRLWVREGWRCTGGGDLRNVIYRADGDSAMSFCGVDDGRTGILHVSEPHWAEWDRLVYKTRRGCNWRSPIHMFKWAARLWLEITGIRVERVQDISLEDCYAEGIQSQFSADYVNPNNEPITPLIRRFHTLWDSINDKRGFGWDKNCYVWVVEFRKVKNGD